MLVLNETDVQSLLTMPDCIEAKHGMLTGMQPGRGDPQELTMYKAPGFAALDLVAAEWVWQRARERGTGIDVPW